MKEFREFIDISRPLGMETAIYPGNPPLTVATHKGATSVHSEITFGSHTGTHIDAPKHVFPLRDGFEEFSLSQFVGPAIVIDVTHVKEKISREDIAHIALPPRARVLFKTANSFRDHRTFFSDYVYLDGDCAEFLVAQGVVLVGIDALSIKQRGGSDNRPHTALLDSRIVILEGILLAHVEAGEYTLIALPLAFEHCDGSPVRAILAR
jgi:arylformamidase